jgi:hypothetical protein
MQEYINMDKRPRIFPYTSCFVVGRVNFFKIKKMLG